MPNPDYAIIFSDPTNTSLQSVTYYTQFHPTKWKIAHFSLVLRKQKVSRFPYITGKYIHYSQLLSQHPIAHSFLSANFVSTPSVFPS